jgi:hypothetical protein
VLDEEPLEPQPASASAASRIQIRGARAIVKAVNGTW